MTMNSSRMTEQQLLVAAMLLYSTLLHCVTCQGTHCQSKSEETSGKYFFMCCHGEIETSVFGDQISMMTSHYVEHFCGA